jgi:hypothetical protein
MIIYYYLLIFSRCSSGELFKNLFWKIWKDKEMRLPKEEDRTKCFMFELLSVQQIIIVQPEEDTIIVHGVR